MDDERNQPKQTIIRERRKVKQIGHILWIIIIVIGILGWVFWKWYIFPICITLAFLMGSIYSYRVTKRVERDTNLNIEEQEAVLKNRSTKESKKSYGFRYNDKGKLVFDLTGEEQAKIKEAFRSFQGYKIHPDYTDEFQKMLTYQSLVELGLDYKFRASLVESEDETERKKEEINDLLEHAIIEYTKAFSIYSIKTILVSIALAFIKEKESLRAKEYLQKYLPHIQSSNYGDTITNSFLQWHLKILGYGSLQELDIAVKEQISHL